MKKYLHYIFVLSGISFFITPAGAQSERVKFAVVEQNKATTDKTEVSENPAAKKEQKNRLEFRLKTDSSKLQEPSLIETNFKSEHKNPEDVELLMQQRRVRDEGNRNDQVVESYVDDAPVFPDLQVVATKEETFENILPVKEKRPEQLVRNQQVVAEDNVIVASGEPETSKMTISPMKRKYLEGLVQELEKEIQSGKENTAVEIAAKKKELDDLKQLLAR